MPACFIHNRRNQRFELRVVATKVRSRSAWQSVRRAPLNSHRSKVCHVTYRRWSRSTKTPPPPCTATYRPRHSYLDSSLTNDDLRARALCSYVRAMYRLTSNSQRSIERSRSIKYKTTVVGPALGIYTPSDELSFRASRRRSSDALQAAVIVSAPLVGSGKSWILISDRLAASESDALCGWSRRSPPL